MIYQMFNLYDSKARAYQPPFFVLNEELAIRPISNAVNDPTHALGRNPADYTIFHVGEYDDQTGQAVPCPNRAICNCIELLRPPEPDFFPADFDLSTQRTVDGKEYVELPERLNGEAE